MKALIWKELRENILWAALAMLALGAAEMYALHHSSNFYQPFYYYDGITLCKKPFLTVTMFGFAVAGIGLGLLQVLPELKRDRWAALLHRPVSRGRFFWGKAIAGIVLYFIAAGAPFLFAVWHVARPGNFPIPFVPAMVTPGLADLAAGLCYYFAALLMALQSGPIACRALPLFAAVHVSFFAFVENLFRVAVESALAMTIALCVAGWGAIHARESLRGRPWLGRIAFLIVAFYGACGAGDLITVLGGMAGRKAAAKFSYWDTLDKGVPARLDYRNNVLVAVTDVNGKPFSEPNYRPDRVRSHTLGMNVATSYVGDTHGWHRTLYPCRYRESNSYMWANQPYTYPRFEQWFYIYGDPVSVRMLVGMLPMEKREFARLGMNGFAPPGEKVPPFPAGIFLTYIRSDMLAIAAPESLRYIYLAKREIAPIALPAPGPIYGMCHSWAIAGNGSVDFQGVALGAGMAVYDVDARVRAMLPYHHNVDRWGRLSLGVLKTMDRFVLKCEPSDWIDLKTRKAMPSYLDLMDSKGTLIASYEMPAPPANVNPPAWNSFIAQRLKSPAFFFGEMLYRRIGAAFGSSRLRAALHKQLGPDFRSTLEVARIVVLVALVLSAITLFWARRAQLPARRVWAWTVGVLLLGIPGFVMFWLVGERPRAVPCAVCLRPRRIEDEHCGWCGAAWPEKPADGTEILDHAPAPSLAASA
jgi:hypothetical protein